MGEFTDLEPIVTIVPCGWNFLSRLRAISWTLNDIAYVKLEDSNGCPILLQTFDPTSGRRTVQALGEFPGVVSIL